MRHIKSYRIWENDNYEEEFSSEELNALLSFIIQDLNIEGLDELDAIFKIASDKLKKPAESLSIRKFDREEFLNWKSRPSLDMGLSRRGTIDLGVFGISKDETLSLSWGTYPGYTGSLIAWLERETDHGYTPEWIIE